MAIKTDSTVDDPDLLEDGGQFIPEYRPPDYEVIGADGGLFGGGLGKPSGNLADVLRTDIEYAPGYRPGQGIFVTPDQAEQLGVDQGNIFLSNPNWTGLLTPISTVSAGPAAPALSSATPAISPGGAQVTGGDTTIEVPTVRGEILTSEQLQGIIKGRLDAKQVEIGRGLTETQANNIIDDVFEELYGRTPFGGVNRPRTQGGIPLVIPLPVDPATGLIITAVGLLASGGNVAKLNPNDPLGSLVDAAKGTAGAVGNVVDVITDPVGAIDRMGTQPGGTTGSGQATTNTPVIIGAGALGGSSSGAGAGGTVGAGQSTTGTGVAVGTGALGGQTPTRIEGTATNEPITERTQSDWSQVVGTGPATIAGAGDIKTGQPTPYKSDVATADTSITKSTPAIDLEGTPSNKPISYKSDIATADESTVPTTGGPSYAGTPSTSTATPSTPIFTPVTPFTFTKTTPGEVAMRDFEKEFGLTSSTLMGQPGRDLANFYQQLQSQFTPSTLTQLAGTSQQQLTSDLDRLAMAQRGQLSPEDVRSAQQSAREAYAARGQVMSPGAIGAEILNRDVIRRQREAEARANVQQSMANLAGAAQIQTGNIFAPFANLLAKTYGPTSEYANAVYDYNVNAYNAYQAAQENLAAYKEAAAKGEEARFINSFVNFLANNGVQTTITAIENIFKKQAAKPTP